MVPEDLKLYLNEHIPCRQDQIDQLTTLLDPALPSPAAIVVHGTTATGKTLTVQHVLRALDVPHAWVRARECVTGRHLLERAVRATRAAAEARGDGPFTDVDGRCETLAALAARLERLVRAREKLVLVVDGADRVREAPPTLVPALVRLGEHIPQLTVLLIATSPRALPLAHAGIPHVPFPAYARADLLAILAARPAPPLFSPETLAELPPERRAAADADAAALWPRVAGAVWDALGRVAARDLVGLRRLARRLWPAFVAPVRAGELGPRDFAKLLVRARGLLQDEGWLAEGPAAPASRPADGSGGSAVAQRRRPERAGGDLPYYARYLLCAAYLASHNPARLDGVYFSKSSEATKKRRRQRQRREKAAGTTPGSTPGRQRAVQRRLLGAQPFALERLLAILHAIVPHPAPRGSADLLSGVATLARLRLLARVPAGGDPLDAGGTKWRCAVGREFVVGVARDLRFDLEELLAD